MKVDLVQLEINMNVYHYNNNIDGAQNAPFITYLIQTLYNPIKNESLIGLLYDNVIPNIGTFDIDIDNIILTNQRGGPNKLNEVGIHIVGRTDHELLYKVENNLNPNSLYIFFDLEGELINQKFYSNLIRNTYLTKNVFVFTDRFFFNEKYQNIFFDFSLKLKFSLAFGIAHDLTRFGFNYENVLTKQNRFYFHTRRIAQTKLNVYEFLYNHKHLLDGLENQLLFSFTNYTFKLLKENTKESEIINWFKNYRNFYIEQESNTFELPLMDDKTNCTLKKTFQIDVLGLIPIYLETSDFSDANYSNTNYFTEKTINYFFQKRPFLCLTKHIHNSLNKMGYDTFTDIFDIDTTLSDAEYYTKIFEKLNYLCNLDDVEFNVIYTNLKERALQNYNKVINDINETPLINKLLNKIK